MAVIAFAAEVWRLAAFHMKMNMSDFAAVSLRGYCGFFMTISAKRFDKEENKKQ